MLRIFPAFAPALALFGVGSLSALGQTDGVAEFEKDILPILEDNCYQCHGDGEDKGKITLDTFGSTADLMKQTDLWVHVLKNIRSGMMPPAKKDRIPAEDFAKLEKWIKNSALQRELKWAETPMAAVISIPAATWTRTPHRCAIST